MKKLLLTVIAATSVQLLTAQTDTLSSTNYDTTKVGDYTIIKKRKKVVKDTTDKELSISVGTDDLLDISIGKRKKKRNENIKTNWFVFDLGFANFIDNTDYGKAQAGSYFNNSNGAVNANSFSLINKKSSNVNIWFFMQKLNLSKHKLNLKYGLGLEMFNYRFEHSLSFRNQPTNYVINDTVSFSKNKLYAKYVTVPFMLNFTPYPQTKKSFSISAGVSASYLLNARNKQISDARGKQKIDGNFELEPFKLAAIAELGLGPIKLYGSYSLTHLFKSSTNLQQYPIAVGIRFSRF